MVPSQVAPVVRMRDVDKTYRVGAVDVQALKGISLDIEPGTFTVVIGPSGSGKTTLLNLVGAIDAPTAGTVELCGQELRSLEDDALSAFRARHRPYHAASLAISSTRARSRTLPRKLPFPKAGEYP